MPVFLVLQTSSIRSPFRRRLPWTSGAAFTAPALLLPAAPRSSPGYEPFSVSSVVVCFSIFKLWGLWCVSFTSLWVFMWFGTRSGRFVGLGHICLFLKKMYNGSKEITSSLRIWMLGTWGQLHSPRCHSQRRELCEQKLQSHEQVSQLFEQFDNVISHAPTPLQ